MTVKLEGSSLSKRPALCQAELRTHQTVSCVNSPCWIASTALYGMNIFSALMSCAFSFSLKMYGSSISTPLFFLSTCVSVSTR